MTPRVFAERMVEVLRAASGEPDVRDAMAIELMKTCLYANGFADGLVLLDLASPEKIPSHVVAKANDSARRQGR